VIAETTRLSKRYHRTWALRDVTIGVAERQVVGLVGPNGAGKTTLLRMLAGLVAPDAGTAVVLGSCQPGSAQARRRIGHIDQQAALYRGLRVRDAFRVARDLNPVTWDQGTAERRLRDRGIPPGRRIGKLSGGQQAQVALTLALARHPRLLLLDEPLASLDPVARQDALGDLMTAVAEDGTTIVISTHAVLELERVASHMIVLTAGQVQIAGSVDDLLASHRNLTGPTTDVEALEAATTVIAATKAGRQTHVLARATQAPPGWAARPVTLEELVLAYLREPRASLASAPALVR
jgi:ABC-2 type transport system ATP-binding protein